MDTLGIRIRKRREELELDQIELAKLAGISQPTLANLESGKNERSKFLPEIAAALKTSVEWLNDGTGGSAKLSAPIPTIEAHGGRTGLKRRSSDDDATVEISNASASMGLGIPMLDHEQTIATMRLTKAWVQSHLPKITSPDNLAILTAYGESMSPTFSGGDMLLVDRGVRAIDRGDRVYVISKNDELYVKRVHRRFSDGAVIIKSDNHLHGPDDVIANGERERLEVLGLVVYAWNGRKL